MVLEDCYSKYYIAFLRKFISFPSRLQLHLEIFQPTFTYKCDLKKILLTQLHWQTLTSALLSVQVGIAVSDFNFQLIAIITEEEKNLSICIRPTF